MPARVELGRSITSQGFKENVATRASRHERDHVKPARGSIEGKHKASSLTTRGTGSRQRAKYRSDQYRGYDSGGLVMPGHRATNRD